MNPVSAVLSRIFSLRLAILALTLMLVLAGETPGFLAALDQMMLGLPGYPYSSVPVAPFWSDAVVHVGLVVSALYLVIAVPRLGAAVALPVTLLIGCLLLVTQAALMFYHDSWLPLGEVVSFLVGGYLLMLFWLQPRRENLALAESNGVARLQLGRLLLQQGRADEAGAALAACSPSDTVLGLLYDIAIVQERKRQYDKAAASYRDILKRDKGFRDVAKRLAALEALAGQSGYPGVDGFDANRTLVIPEQSLSRPTLGRYEIEREIGRGAMGVVYLGRDPRIARTVAIKTLNCAAFEEQEAGALKARFFREAEAAGRLSHPAIVTVYDVGEDADLAYIAMDFARGRPLSDFSRPGKLLPLATVLDIVGRVAEALDYAHGHQIVHRDIKPGNIIYDPATGEVRITDFGIAKIADDSRTRTGSVMGSPLYMSPEQLKGSKVTGHSDIYSLGVTLYKLVSGEPPYDGDTLASLTYQILNKRPRSVREWRPELPQGVVRLINKAIQREPDKRFASAGAMAEAIRRVLVRESERVVS